MYIHLKSKDNEYYVNERYIVYFKEIEHDDFNCLVRTLDGREILTNLDLNKLGEILEIQRRN